MSRFTSGVLFAALTGVCWALLAIGLKYALHFTSTGTIVWVRMVVAFGCLLVYYSIQKPQTIKTVFISPPFGVLAAGLLLAFNYFAYMKGLELTTASNAQVMIQLGPLTLLLVGVMYFKESIRFVQWAGVALAVVGFLFFNWDQILVAMDKSDIYIRGNIWIVFAGVTWAAFATFQKLQMQKGWTPQMINLLVYGVCCLALYPTAELAELAPLNLWQWTVLFLLGLNTLVAYGAFAEAMERIPASYVSLIITINPILTIATMALFAELGISFISPEPLMWRGYLGAGLVILGVAVAVSLRSRQQPTRV